MDVGGYALLALCREQDVASYLNAHLTEDFFWDDEEVELYKRCPDFVLKYHKLPSLETLEETYGDLPYCPEPIDFYLDLTRERFIHKTLNTGLYECSQLVKATKLDDAINVMRGILNTVIHTKYRRLMVEFGEEAFDLIKEAYLKACLSGPGGPIQLGWPTLDGMSGGIGPGDVVSIVGRPAVGKTWFSLYPAHHVWLQQQRNVLFVSMEMGSLPVVQRLAAIHAKVAIQSLKHGNLSLEQQDHMSNALLEVQGHPSKLWVVDGNLAATPSEIFSLAGHLDPDMIFIDGAYLMRHENKKLDRFTRVAENIETLKQATSQLKIPTVCSFQFNREATKNKSKDKEAGLEHIAYSDAIGQVSSIVLGLTQEDNPETMVSKKISILKMREGPIGSFDVRWDFTNMDFSEGAIVNQDGDVVLQPMGHI